MQACDQRTNKVSTRSSL